MKHQKGAALIVVLTLLSISLMVGLSSMQSSQIDERLAGNYKAQSEAQMNAEYAAAEMYKLILSKVQEPNIVSNSLEDGSSSWLNFEKLFSTGELCFIDINKKACYVKVDVAIEGLLGLSPGVYIVAIGAVVEDNEVLSQSELIWVHLVSSKVPNINGAHSCYGEDCNYSAGGNSELTGVDHPVPTNVSCSGDACRTDPDANEANRNDVDQCFYPNVSSTGSFGHCRSSADSINDDADDGIEGWIDFLAALGSGIPFSEEGDSTVNSLGSRDFPALIDVVSGVVSRGNGNINTIGIIVVREGATFKMSGTGHHEGLVIVEEGGELVYDGTPVLYGSVISLNGSIDFDLSVTGNTRVRYSEQAVSMLRNYYNSEDGPTIIASWR